MSPRSRVFHATLFQLLSTMLFYIDFRLQFLLLFVQDGLTPLDLCLYSGQSARTYELIKLFKLPQRRVRHVSKR